MPEPPPSRIATSAEPSPTQRIRESLTRRPTSGQLAVAVLLAALGFAAAVQVRASGADTVYAGARRGDLVQLLDSLDAANSRAERQIAELEATRRELESSTDRRRTALQEAREQATTLAILAGTVPATGPGVIITIEDPGGAVSAATMLNAIEELRDAGAEAIEVNDSARVVAQTYFADGDDGVAVDGAQLKPPYVIDTIGSTATLSVAVEFPGGLEDEVTALGGRVEVQQAETVDVTALAAARSPGYASPTP